MMLTLLNNDERKESYLVIVLQADNLKRMRRADPVTIESVACGGVLPTAKYPDKLMMLVAYEEEEVELYRVAKEGSLGDLLTFLRRGYRYDRDVDGTHRAFSINERKSK